MDGKSWDSNDPATTGKVEKGTRILVEQVAEMTNPFTKKKTLRVFARLTDGSLGDAIIDVSHLFKRELIGRIINLEIDETKLKAL